MLGEILHVGITVSDIEQSERFYRDILGLVPRGGMVMEGPETDRLFAREGTVVDVRYFVGSDALQTPPVELLGFRSPTVKKQKGDLFASGISELCFRVKDIDAEYERLKALGVDFLSAPELFDYTHLGMGKSRAVYFRDPDGTVLELIEVL